MNTQNLTSEDEEMYNRINFLINKIAEYKMVISSSIEEGWEINYLNKYELELEKLNGGIR